MRVGLDTNILVYAAGFGDAAKGERANALLASFGPHNAVIPAQVLGEFFNVMTRKASWPSTLAQETLKEWSDSFPIIATTRETVQTALDLINAHRLNIWDAVILAAARSGLCDTLLSEDMQDGFLWRGVTVVNPFANPDWQVVP